MIFWGKISLKIWQFECLKNFWVEDPIFCSNLSKKWKLKTFVDLPFDFRIWLLVLTDFKKHVLKSFASSNVYVCIQTVTNCLSTLNILSVSDLPWCGQNGNQKISRKLINKRFRSKRIYLANSKLHKSEPWSNANLN